MVFLVGRRRQTVDAVRVGQCLVLAGQGRSGDLGDHEAGVDPAIGHQERRQLRHVLVHHQRDAALGQRADLGDGQGDIVGGHGHGLCVEVATGNHLAFSSEHQRVVGYRVGLDAEHLGGLTQLGQAGAHDLRLATQRVRVLHLVAGGVGAADLAAVAEQVAEGCRRVDLPALATGGMDARIEGRARTQQRLDAERAANAGGSVQVLGLEQPAQGVGGGHLGAVEQGQALLGGQGHRLQAGDGQRLGGRQPFTLV